MHRDKQILTFQEIIDFLITSWKITTITTTISLVAVIVYLITAPRLYEAVAQIKMAQISLSTPGDPFGTTVEDPSSLIARMQLPTNYDQASISACGQDNSLVLSKKIKFGIPRGLQNAVEIKVTGQSPELAKGCAEALTNQIARLQQELSRPFVEGAKVKLKIDNEGIESAKNLIKRADMSGKNMSAAYLAARDEVTYYLNDRDKMTDLINSAELRATKLVSPIYASEISVSPNRGISLLVGLFTGFFAGLFLALLDKLRHKTSIKRIAN